MKLKYILFTLLACIGLLTACTDESAIGNGGDTPTLPEGHAMVTFNFSGIGGTARSYADIAPDSDSLECRVDSVMIYVFNNDMDNNGTADELLAPTDNAVLENIAKVKVEPGVSTAKNEYQAQASFINKGHKWFVIVANFKDTATVYAGMQYSLFKQHCTPDISALPTIPFIMSGADAGMLSSNQPLAIDVELTRAVTRIDITIRNTEEMNATNPFKLKEVRFANVNRKGFLLWNDNGTGGFNEPANLRYTTDWIDVTGAIENNAVSGTDSVWHYLYTYETLAKTGEQVVLELKGDYNGQPSEYKIALTQDEDNGVTPVIPLRNLVRNHRYLVYIDSVTYTDVIGEVIVSDWDFTERDTIPYEPEVSFGSPKATIQNAGNYTILPGTQIGNLTTDTFIVADAGYTAGDVIVIDLESYNMRTAFSSTAAWITAVEEEVSSYAITSDTVVIQQRFKITIDANNEADSYSRNGYFEFRNPILTNNKVGYAVFQMGANGIGTTGAVATGTGITVDNTAKTITMDAYNSVGSVAFTFDENAVIEIPASASARLSLGAVSYATKTQVINIAPNLSYTAVFNDTVTFRYPITGSSEQYVFIHQAATNTTITPTAVTGGVLSEATAISDVAAAGGVLTITVEDNVESPAYELTAADTWFTYIGQNVTTVANGVNKQVTVYTFNVGDNSGNEAVRSTTVTFTNSGGGTHSIVIWQKGTPVILTEFGGTPLVKWAKGNLTGVGATGTWPDLTAANAGTATAEVYGSIYQWGRKVAFPATTEATPATSDDKIDFADGATVSTWLTSGPWHSETGDYSDVWTKLSSGTVQDNDPCPAGWHVPTHDEISEIATNNNDWATGGSWAMGNVKIVGDYAVYYRLVADTSAYTEVKMLPATANGITAANIVSVDWSNASIETRYFPHAGYRNRTTGTEFSVGINGFYWSSNASTSTRAYCLNFFSSETSNNDYSRSNGYSVRCVQN